LLNCDKNASGKILLPGTEAPLVLDAPFGKLDSVYKHATAEFLPRNGISSNRDGEQRTRFTKGFGIAGRSELVTNTL
jgi:hypothetical protein